MYGPLCHESPQQLPIAGSLAATRAPRHILQLSHRGSPSVESDCHGAPCHSQSLCGRVLGVVDERGCLERSTRRFLLSVGPYVSNGLLPESTVRLIRVVCVWGLQSSAAALRISSGYYCFSSSPICELQVLYFDISGCLSLPVIVAEGTGGCFFRGMSCVNRV